MKQFKYLLLTSSFLATFMAYAEEEDEVEAYINFGVGVVLPMQNMDVVGNTNPVFYSPTVPGSSIFILENATWNNDIDSGYDVNVALGYEVFEDVRLEAEFIYQIMDRNISGHYDWNEYSADTGELFDQNFNNPVQSSTSKANVYSLMANAYYDFDTDTAWTPFLGAGIGISWMDSNGTTESGMLIVDTETPPVHEFSYTVEESPALYGTAFAWQVKAGVDYAVQEALSIGLLYRLFGTTDFKATDSHITANPDTIASSEFVIPGQDVDGLLNNTVDVYLRYWF